MGPALLSAYREYLERVFDETDDLVVVDKFTVPTDVDFESPTAQEWAHFE